MSGITLFSNDVQKEPIAVEERGRFSLVNMFKMYDQNLLSDFWPYFVLISLNIFYSR